MAIVSTDTTYTFTVTGNRSLTAVFEPLTPHYTITVIVDPSAAGTVSGGGYYESGKAVTLTYTAAENYGFTGWYNASGALLSTANPYSFTATADVSITAKATYIPVYVITAIIDPAEAGTVAGTGSYQEGAAVTLTVTVNDGYKFTGWKENGAVVSTDNPYTFTAQADKAFTAAFEEHTSRLPAGYTELEYIKSDSHSYIQTDVMADFTTKRTVVDIKAKSYISQTVTERIFGAPTKSPYYFSLYRSNNESVYSRYSSNTGVKRSVNITNTRLTIDWDFVNNKLSIGSNTYNPGTSKSSIGTNIQIFGESSISANLYSAQIYASGTLVGNYVPCTNPSGAVGVYDLVSNKFYANAGTGTFTAGPAV